MKATLAAAPFESICAQPFVDSTVTKAVAPDFTEEAKATIDTTGPEVVILVTAVDGTGKPIEAWPLAHDGNVADFDRTSVVAGRLAKYQGAISYCRPVPSYYEYSTWAWPD